MWLVKGQDQVLPGSDVGAGPLGLQGLALAMLDQIDGGLIACDDMGVLLHANRAAWRELRSGRLLRVQDGALRCIAGLQDDFAVLVRDAALKRRSRMAWLGEGEAAQLVLAMPVPVPARDVVTPAALLMLGRRSLCSPLGLEMLALQHGLTAAEQRVMRALTANQSPRQIASEHGVAMCTVRTQIHALRAKLGVRSVDALLLRAAQVPPVSSWSGCDGAPA